jgi:5,6-dimethylbenzimidazole synthase
LIDIAEAISSSLDVSSDSATKSNNPHAFTSTECAAVYRAIAERRDIRHFTKQPVNSAVLKRLLDAAHQAPSVGLMQPWRFIRITDLQLRECIQKLVETERLATAAALSERTQEFLRLKVEGIQNCGELIVVALMDQREEHIFGRRTLPQMDLASVACAIQNMWLAARAEGLGMGWVSLFDPIALAALLNMPSGSEPIAILCLGHVEQFYPAPMLQIEGWREPDPLAYVVMENGWQTRE